MLLEIILLLVGPQGGKELAQAGEREEALLRFIDILVDDDFFLEDLGDLVLADTAGGMIRGSVLRYYRPVIDLDESDRLSRQETAAEGTYMVDEGIGQDIVVGGELREGERLLPRRLPGLRRHCVHLRRIRTS